MRLSNRFKVFCWLVALAVVSFLGSKRYSAFADGSATQMDFVIFLTWLCLVVAPLFREVNFLGFSVKSELQSLRSDMTKELSSFKAEVRDSVNVRTQVNPQITFSTPASDSELRTIERVFRSVLEEKLKISGTPGPIGPIADLDLPSDTQFLFSVRYAIDRELKRIWDRDMNSSDPKKRKSTAEVLRRLGDSGPLLSILTGVTREVYAICSASVHGDPISDEQVTFVRNVASELLASLKAV